MDNYALAAQNAKKRFLTYDPQAIVQKFSFPADDRYIYPTLLGTLWRVDRATGDLQRKTPAGWQEQEDFDSVMVMFDLLCDSRPDRHLSGTLKSTQEFGVHRSLLENERDPLARFFDREPEKFSRACTALGGRPAPYGDLGFTVPLFEDLEILVTFWHSDGEFAPRLRFCWDENALMYLKYETMHYALTLLRRALQEAADGLC